jgi:hypothetical protein
MAKLTFSEQQKRLAEMAKQVRRPSQVSLAPPVAEQGKTVAGPNGEMFVPQPYIDPNMGGMPEAYSTKVSPGQLLQQKQAKERKELIAMRAQKIAADNAAEVAALTDLHKNTQYASTFLQGAGQGVGNIRCDDIKDDKGNVIGQTKTPGTILRNKDMIDKLFPGEADNMAKHGYPLIGTNLAGLSKETLEYLKKIQNDGKVMESATEQYNPTKSGE